MIKIEDILSLTEFHRRSRDHINHLRATGRPQVLTINGKAELIVQDATAYQQLLDRLRQDESDSKKNTTVRSSRQKSDKSKENGK